MQISDRDLGHWPLALFWEYPDKYGNTGCRYMWRWSILMYRELSMNTMVEYKLSRLILMESQTHFHIHYMHDQTQLKLPEGSKLPYLTWLVTSKPEVKVAEVIIYSFAYFLIALFMFFVADSLCPFSITFPKTARIDRIWIYDFFPISIRQSYCPPQELIYFWCHSCTFNNHMHWSAYRRKLYSNHIAICNF